MIFLEYLWDSHKNPTDRSFVHTSYLFNKTIVFLCSSDWWGILKKYVQYLVAWFFNKNGIVTWQWTPIYSQWLFSITLWMCYPEKWVVICLCVSGIDFVSFYDFSVLFRQSFIFCFCILLPLKYASQNKLGVVSIPRRKTPYWKRISAGWSSLFMYPLSLEIQITRINLLHARVDT